MEGEGKRKWRGGGRWGEGRKRRRRGKKRDKEKRYPEYISTNMEIMNVEIAGKSNTLSIHSRLL